MRSKIINMITKIWTSTESYLNPILQHLDPSLFQTVILGILAIFIPFSIVFLSDILHSKKQKSDFEKMVLSEKVLNIKMVFILSIFCIFILAFFSGKDTSYLMKLFSTIFSIIIIRSLWTALKRILRFSEGYKSEFEISFLQSLYLSKYLPLKTK